MSSSAGKRPAGDSKVALSSKSGLELVISEVILCSGITRDLTGPFCLSSIDYNWIIQEMGL